jgi:hypothetical protein
MMRAMEWNDARARYPNVWHEGMPCQLLASDRVAQRLRLGDLIAIYYPASQRHPERSERFLGLSRVAVLRRAHEHGFGWIELETAHRFDPPVDLKQQPSRVFLCCDPGWPGPEVAMFAQLFDAATAAGWQPNPDEVEPVQSVGPEAHADPASPPAGDVGQVAAAPETPLSSAAAAQLDHELVEHGRLFAGVDYSGDMRDPRESTWLATVALQDDRLHVIRLEATGRAGLESYLRDPGRTLMNVEAIGLTFPFGLPLPFAESLLGGKFPEEGWWALAKKLERFTRPEYLIRIQEYREAQGEPKRLTDEMVDAPSPLYRLGPDLGSRSFHGIRMIAEDRSRYAMRPFETAQGKLLLEVYPGALFKRVLGDTQSVDERERLESIVAALPGLESLPLIIGDRFVRHCRTRETALRAVVAARCAAIAVMSGESEKAPDELAPGEGDRVRREGWIYGVKEATGLTSPTDLG